MQVMSISDILSATGGELVHKSTNSAYVNIKGITTDSRKAGEGMLFIPLKGETRDGHDFINSAVADGAVSLTERCDSYTEGDIIKVMDTRKALGDIAKYYKSKYPIPTVSITGSVGKTTTKDLVYSVISQGFNTHKTPNNFNNDIGVPLTVFGIEKEHTAAVIEMGMNHFGEIEYLADIVKPDCAIITNIGMSHIENLLSQEGILRAKLEITKNFTDKNTLFVNGDDKYLSAIPQAEHKIVRYGLDTSNDVYAKDIINKGLEGVSFTAVCDKGEFDVTIRQPGVHNVYNALAAICAGLYMGLGFDECAKGIEECVYTSSRLEIIQANGVEIINDCYNASPDSVRAALKVMALSLKPRKVAILGDILEMGEFAPDAHYKLGEAVKDSGVDLLITAGEMAKHIATGAKDAGAGDVISFDTTDALKKEITTIIKNGDCVLVKASHGMRFIEITEALTSSM